MKHLLIASLILSFSAHAKVELDIFNVGDFSKAEPKVIIGLGSYHLDKIERAALNQVNPGVGFEVWDVQTVYVTKNSWGNPSFYVTYTPEYEFNDYFAIGLQAGVATNYKCTDTVKYNNMTYTTGYCSDSGVVLIGGATAYVNPFADGWGIDTTITPVAIMLDISYKF